VDLVGVNGFSLPFINSFASMSPKLSSRHGDVSRRLSPNSPKRTTAFSPSGCSSQIWCAYAAMQRIEGAITVKEFAKALFVSHLSIWIT
jgi:hypothetical protein